jgi:hypothetical protein
MGATLGNIIVAIIGAISAIAVAVITTRAGDAARVKPAVNGVASAAASAITPYAQKLRTLAQILIGWIYLLAIVCFVLGVPKLLNAYQISGYRSTALLEFVIAYYYALSWGLIYTIGGVILGLVGYWAQRQLNPK